MSIARRILFCLVLASACATTRPEGVRVTAAGIELRLRRTARTVAVAGDFNGWSTSAHPMARDGDLWSCRLVLPPGEYLFMYVVDGREWVTPAHAEERVPDGFGGWNGRLVVP